MKKNLLGWFAMATMLVGSGCSSDEVVNDYSPENAIQFGTYVGRGAESRATPLTTTNLTSFGVFAYYTGQNAFTNSDTPNFMRNQLVSKDASVWSYSPIKYWPNNANDKISFFAYAPYWDGISPTNNISGIPGKDTSGDPQIAFNVSNQVGEHVDLLYADVTDKMNLTKQNVSEKITFRFNHALARIGFKVEAMIDVVNGDADGTIDDNDSHSPSLGKDAATTILVDEVTLTGNFYTSGDLNLNSGEWSTPISPTPVSYTLNTSNFEADVANNVTTTKQRLNNENSYLMVIPQDFKTTNKMKLKVVYRVVTKDDNLEDGESSITNTFETEEFNIAEGFTKGKAYNLCLHIGLTSVKLSAEVSEWDPVDGTDYVVNVPINTDVTP